MTAGSAWTCAGVPTAITLPKSSTVIVLQTDIMRSIRCSITTTLVSAASFSISSPSSGSSASDRPLAGSSSSSTRGRATSARASATRLRRPYASVSGMLSARSAAPTRSSACSARSRSVRSSRSDRGRPNSAVQNPARAWLDAPTITFSTTVSPPNRPTPCSVRAMPRPASRCGRRPVSSRSPNWMVPESGLTNPHSTLSKVVLPAPFGPMMPVT